MQDFDLLDAVQPESGWFAIVGIKEGKAPRQVLVATREEADSVAESLVAQGRNAFFGVAKYETDKNRTKDNVKALKAFWLDIDCGENKPYATQEEGLRSLQTFTKTLGLPRPIVINSGRGLHVYWALTQDITRAEWEMVADRLQQVCNTQGLAADPACFEVARILRIPGTYNFKGDEPAEVTVVCTGKPIEFGAFKKLLGVKTTEISPLFGDTVPVKRELTHLQQQLADNNEYSFAKIMTRSLKGEGCHQLKEYYENRSEMDYMRWFHALTVAAVCKDSAEAIHKISQGHPDYDPVATEQKASTISGATSCEKFEANNPGGCEGCKWKGIVYSPKGLGKEIATAEVSGGVYIAKGNDADSSSKLRIPEYPFPYVRGKNGGIYKLPPKDPTGTSEADPILVYRHDIFITKRMYDPSAKTGVIVIKLPTPNDGVKELSIQTSKLSSEDKVREALASQSVLANKKQFAEICNFVMLAAANLHDKQKEEQMRMQFGWADNDSVFIAGDREVTVDGVFYSPPSEITEEVAPHMGPVGSFDKWREVFNLYNRTGLEGNAFAALTAFGAPLFKFSGHNGAVINVIHPNSGTGKTTILHMCNSVWGHPKELCNGPKDTENARITALGVKCNLPFTVDEITNMPEKVASDLLYAMSNGKGKERMEANGNKLRANNTKWQTIGLCSSNASFVEKLRGGSKGRPDGELMRLLEYKIDYSGALDIEFAKQMFDHQLLENYGHAGLKYAEWLVCNRDTARLWFREMQQKIDRELHLTQRERFWSSVLAANLTGGRIAKRLELHDWDMKEIYQFSADMIHNSRNETTPPPIDCMHVVGDYINRHINNVLVVNDKADARTNMQIFPIVEPKGELLIRWEPDTKRMFLVVSAFRKDCAATQTSYTDTVKELKARGILTEANSKRMTKGMKVSGVPGVHALELDGNHSDFLDMSYAENLNDGS
jgi:uncharacterized protein (DUF927 family)